MKVTARTLRVRVDDEHITEDIVRLALWASDLDGRAEVATLVESDVCKIVGGSHGVTLDAREDAVGGGAEVLVCPQLDTEGAEAGGVHPELHAAAPPVVPGVVDDHDAVVVLVGIDER